MRKHTQFFPTGPRLGQELPGPFGDPAALNLGHAGQSAKNLPAAGGGCVKVGKISEQEAAESVAVVLPSQALHQLSIPSKAVELCHHDNGAAGAGVYQCPVQLGAIGTAPSLNFGEPGHHLIAPGFGQLQDSVALGVEAQSPILLALGADIGRSDQIQGSPAASFGVPPGYEVMIGTKSARAPGQQRQQESRDFAPFLPPRPRANP